MKNTSLRSRVISRGYDRFTRRLEEAFLADVRTELLRDISGDVLEIGGGTGANLSHYPPMVDNIDVIEPDPNMVRIMEPRMPPHARVTQTTAEDLPFPDDAFDAVVCTLALCTIPDPDRALREARRVLRPAGQFVFAEHVRSTRPRVARMQDRVETAWSFLTVGCHPNRDAAALIAAAGFDIESSEYLELPRNAGLVRDFIWGTAEVT